MTDKHLIAIAQSTEETIAYNDSFVLHCKTIRNVEGMVLKIELVNVYFSETITLYDGDVDGEERVRGIMAMVQKMFSTFAEAINTKEEDMVYGESLGYGRTICDHNNPNIDLPFDDITI